MEEKKKSFKLAHSNKYFTIGVYTIVVIFICAVLVKVILNLSASIGFLKNFLKGMAPFLVGILIAYCINPLYNWLYHKALKKLLNGHLAKVRKYLAIIISYVIFVGVILSLLVYIIPNILNSFTDLIGNAQLFYNNIVDWLDDLAKKYPELDLEYIEKSLSGTFPSAVELASSGIAKIGSKIYGTSMSLLSWIYNVLMGFVVSFYLIFDKSSMIRALKRAIYAVFPEDTAKKIVANLRESNEIFSNFIIGKFFDSLIIGIICFVFCKILHIEYALIVSLVVGITNMIPYIGPFIGGFIGGLLLLIISPTNCIEFLILVFVLQQFDGFILGPKILGDKTGLRPFWILFAVTLGGWAAGAIGMFLGVPIVAVVANFADKYVTAKLKEKELDIPKVYATEKMDPDYLNTKKNTESKQ